MQILSVTKSALPMALLTALCVACGDASDEQTDDATAALLPQAVYTCAVDGAGPAGDAAPARVRVVPQGKKATVEVERAVDSALQENVPMSKQQNVVTLQAPGYTVAMDLASSARTQDGKPAFTAKLRENGKTYAMKCRGLTTHDWFHEYGRLSASFAGLAPYAIPARVQSLPSALQSKIRAADAAIVASARAKGIQLPAEDRLFRVQYTHNLASNADAGYVLWALHSSDVDSRVDLTWTVAFDARGNEVLRAMAERPE